MAATSARACSTCATCSWYWALAWWIWASAARAPASAWSRVDWERSFWSTGQIETNEANAAKARADAGYARANAARLGKLSTQGLIPVVLCALSGAIGVLLGVVASSIFSNVLGWVMIIPPRAIVIAVLFSGLIGVGFGFYPARKALLDPIEALRYE
jgi:hypothetical protein